METGDVMLLLGILIGEGSMGQVSKQPAIQVKMHVRHEPVLRRLHNLIDGSKLYGPYHHQGRDFFILRIMGRPLRNLCTTLDQTGWAEIDPHSYSRYVKMKQLFRQT